MERKLRSSHSGGQQWVSICSENFLSQITLNRFTSWVVSEGDYLDPVLAPQISSFVTWGRMFYFSLNHFYSYKNGHN